MIIDNHCHLFSEDLPTRTYWEGYVKFAAAVANRPEERIWNRIKETWDITGELIISDMDEAGIGKSVMLPLDYMPQAGTGSIVGLEEQHMMFIKAVQKPRKVP